MARPMPREAPVTRATLFSNLRVRTDTSGHPDLEQRMHLIQISHCLKMSDARLGQRAPHESAQHLSWTDFEEVIAAELSQALHGLDPAHWRVQLDCKLAAQLVLVLGRLGGAVEDDRDGGGAELGFVQRLGKSLGSRTHVHRMERHADVQWQHPSCAPGPRGFADALDGSPRPGYHHLRRRMWSG